MCLFCLHVADPPRITTHPQDLKDVTLGKSAKFAIQATGTDPLSYHWQWKPAEEEGEWRACDADWSDGAALTIPGVAKSHKGSYRCIVSNCAGKHTSNSARLSVSKNLPVFFVALFLFLFVCLLFIVISFL